MIRYLHWSLALTFVTTSALAQNSAAPNRGAGPPGNASARGARLEERSPPRAAGKDRDGREKGRPDSSPRGPSERGAHHGGRHFHRLDAELHAKFREKKLNPEELKKTLEEWRNAREERKSQHRRALLSRWGNALGRPNVEGELKLHAERMARLQRMEQLVATEKTGDTRERLLARIEKIREREASRHERAMHKLAGSGAAPASSEAPASGTAPAPSPAPSAEGSTP